MEASTYLKLKECQGDIIPKCYGGYTVKFPERELCEDQEVNLLLVARIYGPRLDTIPYWRTNEERKRDIYNQILGILEKLNARSVYMPQITPDQFIVEQVTGRVIVIDFIGTVTRDPVRAETKFTTFHQNDCLRGVYDKIRIYFRVGGCGYKGS